MRSRLTAARPKGRRGHPRGGATDAATGVGSAPARFAQRARRARMRPWRVALGFVLVLAAAAGVWWLLVASSWFRVSTVSIVGAEGDRVAVIREAARGIEGQPLIEVDVNSIDHDVTATNLFAVVDVTRSWPSEITIRVEERTPAVASRLAGGSYELIDREGVAYEVVREAPVGVPEVSLAGPSDAASRATAAAVGLALPADLRARVDSFRVDRGARASFTIDRIEVLWGDGADSAIKAAVLRPLLDRGRVARIDLTVPTNPVTSQKTSTSGSSEG